MVFEACFNKFKIQIHITNRKNKEMTNVLLLQHVLHMLKIG